MNIFTEDKIKAYIEKMEKITIGSIVYFYEQSICYPLDETKKRDPKEPYIVTGISECEWKDEASKKNKLNVCNYCVGTIELDKDNGFSCYTCGHELEFSEVISSEYITEDDFSL